MHLVFITISLVGFLFVFTMGQDSTAISYISSEQIVDINGTVNLECSIDNGQDFPIVWVKLDQSEPLDSLIFSSGSSMIIRDNRLSLRYDHVNNTYTLQIKEVQESDGGIYQCQVVISAGNKIMADVPVLVRIPPVIMDNSTSSEIAKEGMPVTLECYAEGYPLPRISWRRENNAILPTGGLVYHGNVLINLSIKKEDRGMYYCVAENGVGRGVRRNVSVEVEFAPVVSTSKPRVGQALNYDTDLECQVEAYPLPVVKWLKDNQEIFDNTHYHIQIFATSDDFTESIVRVITIENSQYGRYVCSAQNQLGSQEATLELFETLDPVCPPACQGENFMTNSTS